MACTVAWNSDLDPTLSPGGEAVSSEFPASKGGGYTNSLPDLLAPAVEICASGPTAWSAVIGFRIVRVCRLHSTRGIK